MSKNNIDYDDFSYLLEGLSQAADTKSGFAKQVISDGGKFFVGCVSPLGVRVEVGVMKTDELLED